LKTIERRSDFDGLGAHWSSSEQELRAGYEQLLDTYREDRFQSVMDERIAELIGELRDRASVLWERLSSVSGRQAARRKFVGPDQIRMVADVLQQQAAQALGASNFRLVKTCCDRIVDLNPEGVEGRQALARVRKWLSDPRVASADTMTASELADLQHDLDRLG
ncbi:MAG: hypothetical protein VX498_04610, partial [Myxococcota bacterium]|nr:hypothetical protein [Myxococcota bacterium]